MALASARAAPLVDLVARHRVLAALIFLAIFPWLAPYKALAVNILIFGLFAMGFNLIYGYAGMLSFGHAALFGLGAYGCGIPIAKFGVPWFIGLPLGVAIAGVASVVIGWFATRSRGIYFAMVTLAFCQMVYYVANEWRPVTGGENGVQGIPHTLGSLDLADPRAFYYAALPLLLVCYWAAHRVVHSPLGHVLVAIRDNEARAQALGYPTRTYKLLAFLISAALSGLAGAVFTLGHSFASLDLVDWRTSGQVVIMTILGGIGTLWGGVIGAAIFLLLRDSLSTITDAWGVITGTVFVVIVLAFRRGVWGTILHFRLPRARGVAVAGATEAPAVQPTAESESLVG